MATEQLILFSILMILSLKHMLSLSNNVKGKKRDKKGEEVLSERTACAKEEEEALL